MDVFEAVLVAATKQGEETKVYEMLHKHPKYNIIIYSH